MVNFLKKFFNKIPTFEVDKIKFIFFMAIILSIIENIPSFINKFQVNSYNNMEFLHNLCYLFIEGLSVFAIFLTILFVFSFNKYILKLLIGVFLCVSSIFIYILYVYKVIIDEILFLNLIQANSSEVSEMLTMSPIIIFIILGLIPTLYIIFFIKFKSNASTHKYYLTGIFWEQLFKKITYFVAIPVLTSLIIIMVIDRGFFLDSRSLKHSLSKYLPLNYIGASYQYFYKLRKDIKLSKNKICLYDLYDFEFNSALKNEPLTIVLVIGESSRAQSQSYNGYYRNTNKYTKDIPDLVYLKNVKSCNTHTAGSVPCMLSYRTRAEFSMSSPETGLISVFKHLGFKTYWISTQTAYVYGLNPIFRVAMEASEVAFVNSVRPYIPSGSQAYDGITLNSLVKKAIDAPYKHKLIVFQLVGSHIKYTERFPENFMVFTPSAKLNPKDDSIFTGRNDYDNTVIYTDYVLSLLINMLKEQNTLLLYMSDHGESLAVDNSGFIAHSTPYDIAPKEQTQVAACMWLSKGMQRLIPNALHNIKKYSELPISHDYIFSTLFGSIGVESSVINKKLDLTSCEGIDDARVGKYR